MGGADQGIPGRLAGLVCAEAGGKEGKLVCEFHGERKKYNLTRFSDVYLRAGHGGAWL